MLVLARNAGEGILITTPSGELIKILIKDITFQKYYNKTLLQTKVGIIAPLDYDIVREEIYILGQEKFKKNLKKYWHHLKIEYHYNTLH